MFILLINKNKFLKNTIVSITYSKVKFRNLPNLHPNNGYFFINTLDIKTETFSLNYINSTNQNRLNVIMKLHKKG